MGRHLASERLIPDRVIVSGARRTRQTWELIAPHLPPSIDVHFDKRIYEAPYQALLGVVRENLDSAETLMLVGHNPGLQSLALHLARRDASPKRRKLETKYPTCGLAVLDFLFLDWADVMPDTGIIERFETPNGLGLHEMDD
jgi:phosphohistidine phosphatase